MDIIIRSSPLEHADPSLFIGVVARDCLRNALRRALSEGEVTNATANAKIKRLADLTSQGRHGHESKALKSSCVLFRFVQICSELLCDLDMLHSHFQEQTMMFFLAKSIVNPSSKFNWCGLR